MKKISNGLSKESAGKIWDLLDTVSDLVLHATSELEGDNFRCTVCNSSAFEECAEECIGAYLLGLLTQSEQLKELLETRHGVEDTSRDKFD